LAETREPGFPYRPLPETEKATLKPNAVGFVGGLVIGLASTAPAYSLAAVIGSLVVIVGLQAPAAVIGYGFLLLGFVLVVVWRLTGHEHFFGRKPFESVDRGSNGDVAMTESMGLEP
jgi:hypothetical protein